MELRDAIENFLQFLSLEKKVSPLTVVAYRKDCAQFLSYFQSEPPQVSEVKSLHVRAWLAELKDDQLTNRSIRRKASALKSFFQYQIQIGEMKTNPVRQVVLPRMSKTLPHFLEYSQTELIVEKSLFSDPFEEFTAKLIIELFYQTGMRRAELMNLKEGDIRFQRKEILVFGKGNKERVIPVNDFILQDLQEYIALKRKKFENPTNYLLSLKSGNKLYANYVYRIVRKYLSAITTLDKKSPHLLRHTFASQLLNNGASLMAIKDLLGHSSLAATQIYTHINIEKLKDVYKNAHPKS